MLLLLVSFFFSAHALASSDADVYEPKLPVVATVVFVHGGAWLGGDKAEYASLAPTFTSQGFRFVSLNYRLAPKFKHPAPVEDLDRAIAKYDNVYLMGHSAGAHMIAFWNASHASNRVKGFIGLEGIYDVPKLLKVWPSYKDWFIAQEFGTESSKYAAASPTLLPMKSKARWLVVHSEKDELVDLAQSSEFVAHLKKEGVPVEFVRLSKESHFEAVTSLSNPSSESAKSVLKFLKAK
jgi:kynurenine formamidase